MIYFMILNNLHVSGTVEYVHRGLREQNPNLEVYLFIVTVKHQIYI